MCSILSESSFPNNAFPMGGMMEYQRLSTLPRIRVPRFCQILSISVNVCQRCFFTMCLRPPRSGDIWIGWWFRGILLEGRSFVSGLLILFYESFFAAFIIVPQHEHNPM